MCPSKENKRISPSLETIDKRSGPLVFSRRLPNSSSNGSSAGKGSKSTKPKGKSGTTKTSRSGSEDNAGKVPHFKSFPFKRGIFERFVYD